MKFVFPIMLMFSFSALAEEATKKDENWGKTKKVINQTAEKIDSGTRSVIKKVKAKANEKKAKKDDHDHEHDEHQH